MNKFIDGYPIQVGLMLNKFTLSGSSLIMEMTLGEYRQLVDALTQDLEERDKTISEMFNNEQNTKKTK